MTGDETRADVARFRTASQTMCIAIGIRRGSGQLGPIAQVMSALRDAAKAI